MRDDFPLLRSILGDPYAEAEGDELTAVVESIYGPGATPEDVEGFLSSIGKGFKKAAGAVGGFAQKALPGVLSGALSGAAVGGPWGALIGAVAGGAGSALAGSKNKTARTLGGALGSAGNLLSTVRGGGGAAGALGSLLNVGGRSSAGGVSSLAALGTGALGGILQPGRVPAGGANANTLMAMLSRPELLHSVLAGTMAQFGRKDINVGGQSVPVHAMLSTLSKVAGRAAQEVAEFDEQAEDVPEYVSWAEAEFGIDPDDTEGRTDALLMALALAPNLWAVPPRPITVNVTTPDPKEPPLHTAEAWTELSESSVFEWESDEADWEADEAWTDGEDTEAWASEPQESAYAWQ